MNGRWLIYYYDGGDNLGNEPHWFEAGATCSVCHRSSVHRLKECPYCGAKMSNWNKDEYDDDDPDEPEEDE